MARVALYFDAKTVRSPRFGDDPFRVIRLLARAQFASAGGRFTEPMEAVVDTGAPLAVLPDSVWRSLEAEVRVPEASFEGISPGQQCQVEVSFGAVRGRLVDADGNSTRMYTFPAFLAKTDRVPLIIGFADLLEKLDNHFNYQTGEAWVQEQ